MMWLIAGYVGALAMVGVLAWHLVQTVLLKKYVEPGLLDMLVFALAPLLMFGYAVWNRNVPIALFTLALSVWSILGTVDYFRKGSA